MRVHNQQAYVLHRYPFRDNSQIIELFSLQHGRVSVISKNGKAGRSQRQSLLQPFRSLILSWSGKTDLPTLTQVEADPGPAIQLSGAALACGFYLNELLMHLLHRHEELGEIYYLYQQTLQQLNQSPDQELVLRLFEKQLLDMLGFQLNLCEDAASGEPLDETLDYEYFIELGPVARHLADQPGITRLGGASLLAYDRGDLSDPQHRRDIKRLMRNVIHHYLNGKPLKSRELFR